LPGRADRRSKELRLTEAGAARGGYESAFVDEAHGHAAALKQLWLLILARGADPFADAFLAIMACFTVATAVAMRSTAPLRTPTTDAH
jgi:hypothetical protein